MGSKLLILLCTLLLINYASSQLAKATLGGVIRDQAPNTMLVSSIGCKSGYIPSTANNGQGFFNTDFQMSTNDYENDEYGLCGPECNQNQGFTNCGMLGADQTPAYVFPGKSPKGNVHSPTSFYQWFHTTPQNVPVNVNITLTQDQNGNTFTFSNDEFFPINGKGWGDYCIDNNQQRNFGFCMEAHTRFGYKGGETFYFSGDDDLWVYINNYLVIDLGSLHPRRDKSVSLDTIPFLVKGSNYRLDFFYCERHTSFSRIKLTTTLSFYCSYDDWCGICEGTGQSCCTQSVIKQYCDDKNDCTTDTCAVRVNPKDGGCVHTPVNCAPQNACVVAECLTVGGCKYTTKNCDDGDACTIDSCNPVSGCVYARRTCNDNSECSVDTCNSATGCVFTKKNCNDSNACTIDSCNNSTGCTYSPTPPCNDNNACTSDSCNSTVGCVFKNITSTCNDGDPCTTDSCNPSVGCVKTAVNCNTGNLCLNQFCSPTNGSCMNVTINCPPRDNCSIAQCFPSSGCSNTAKNCDFGDRCRIYSCDLIKGCQSVARTCSDGNACTQDLCDPSAGCYFPPIVLDDGNACTNDTCNTVTGPSHTTITCNDNNACTDDSCRNSSGCLFVPKDCEFGDPCMDYGCNTLSGCTATRKPGCTTCTLSGSPVNCTTTDRCFPAVCAAQNAGCTNTTVNCNDNNACTDDICTNGVCSNPDKPCTANNLCDIAACDRVGGCKHTQKTCNDNNPCTADSCGLSNGACSNTLIAPYCVICGTNACNYTDPCNPYICDATTLTCKKAPVNCDDNNFCTNDSCAVVGGVATCQHPAITCAGSGNACRPNVCNPSVGCQIQPVVCADTDKCTNDTCVDVGGSAQCRFPAVVCPTTDLCNPLFCSATDGNCYPIPVSCDDHNACTNDSCLVVNNNSTVCVNQVFTCPTDICGTMDCNTTTGTCSSAINSLVCDDGNLCTTDVGYCTQNATFCNFTLNTYCDDGDACTNELCDSSNKTYPCSYSNVTCTAASACQISSGCDTLKGCVFTPLVCPVGDNCNIGSCDLRAGCILESRVCSVGDPDCFEPICTVTTDGSEPCGQRRLDWAIRVQCALKYNKEAAIGIGAAVGIAIGGAAVLGIAGFGGKKGYDMLKMMREQRFGGVQNNPLYEATQANSDNPLYRYSTGAPPS